MNYSYIQTPIGSLLATRTEKGIASISFMTNGRPVPPQTGWRRSDGLFHDLREQLGSYFDGHLTSFDLPLDPAGTTFQCDVWTALLSIPYGATRSYSEIARAVGRPKAVRAVGAANGANPLPIVVPCHRVIGSNGSLTGFGGGMDVKKRLLELEAGSRTLWEE
jgi:methylated-DNA-[protein]-cysteine S-methyltransferase